VGPEDDPGHVAQPRQGAGGAGAGRLGPAAGGDQGQRDQGDRHQPAEVPAPPLHAQRPGRAHRHHGHHQHHPGQDPTGPKPAAGAAQCLRRGGQAPGDHRDPAGQMGPSQRPGQRLAVPEPRRVEPDAARLLGVHVEGVAADELVVDHPGRLALLVALPGATGQEAEQPDHGQGQHRRRGQLPELVAGQPAGVQQRHPPQRRPPRLGGPLGADAGRVAAALVGDQVEGDRADVQHPEHGQGQPEHPDQGPEVPRLALAAPPPVHPPGQVGQRERQQQQPQGPAGPPRGEPAPGVRLPVPPVGVRPPIEPGGGVPGHQHRVRLAQGGLGRLPAHAVHQQLGHAVERDRLVLRGVSGLGHR
jgi:hypothetical protein